ncbi:hypothetical protein PCASD_02165 [Puccinia coronata f. sp. avenae]|uniref:Uncharacterized protein n=1 Tax=Puccinia coronata f. sp. avenae TaxID=200324 RepID=A0A2N5VIB4_9BASI|nr:hypothetical protein PCASD_02165 [Puccinia coronata f. sp. avenae]
MKVCGVRTPFRRAHAYLHAQKNGVQPLHAASERRAEAARPSLQAAAIRTPSIGVHMACNPARQACRACTPVWRACKACTPFGQACRLCTPVGSRKPLDSRGLREPRNWCYGVRSSNCAAHVSLSNQEAYVSQPRPVPLELTWARVQKPATKFNHPDP